VDVYEALQEKLNTNPLGAPKRAEFLEILRLLFTPEEAELATHLPFTPQRAREIAAAFAQPETVDALIAEGRLVRASHQGQAYLLPDSFVRRG